MLLSDIRQRIYHEMAVGRANPSKTYWHGTTGFLGKKIAKDGLLKSGKKVWDVNGFQAREGHVYLGSELGPALGYMDERVWRNKKYRGSKATTGAIVKVHVADPEKLVIDENDIANIFMDLYRAEYGPSWSSGNSRGGTEDFARRILEALPEEDADAFRYTLDDEWEWEYDDNEVYEALTAVAKDHIEKILKLPGIGDELLKMSNEAGYPGDLPVTAVWLVKHEDFENIKTEADLNKYGQKIPVAKSR